MAGPVQGGPNRWDIEPDRFTGMRPAPWIDSHVISEGRKLAGGSLVDVPPVAVPRTAVAVPVDQPTCIERS
jgi:hypothetical protein